MSRCCRRRVFVANGDSSSIMQMYSLGEDVASRIGEPQVMKEETGISQLRRQWCLLFLFGWCIQFLFHLTIVLLSLAVQVTGKELVGPIHSSKCSVESVLL